MPQVFSSRYTVGDDYTTLFYLVRSAAPRRKRLGARFPLWNGAVRLGPGRGHGCTRLASNGAPRPLDKRPQRYGLLCVASGSGTHALRSGQAPVTVGGSAGGRASARSPRPRRHGSLDQALGCSQAARRAFRSGCWPCPCPDGCPPRSPRSWPCCATCGRRSRTLTSGSPPLRRPTSGCAACRACRTRFLRRHPADPP